MKKVSFRSFLAGLWIILMVFVLVSCTANAPESPVPAQEGSSTQTPQGSNVPPLPAEKPVLRICTYNAVLNIEPTELAGFFGEKTGYTIEHIMLPADNGLDKLMLDLATGEEYDGVTTNFNWYTVANASNAYMALNDLIDAYGPNIKAGIKQETWDMLSSDGTYTGIPSPFAMSRINKTMAIRKDVLDKYNLSMPTTLDEFYDVLKEIKAKTDMIPLVVGPDGFIDTIGSAFGLSVDYKIIDNKAVPRIFEDNYLDYLKFVNKLYNEGLLDPEMPSNKNDTIQEKFVGGRAFAVRYQWNWAATYKPALLKNVENSEIAIVRPLIGPNNEREISATGKGIEFVFSIPKTSKKAASVMDFANATLEPDNFKYLTIGEEGIHHEVRNGEYYPIIPAFDKFNNANLLRAGAIEDAWEKYWQCRVRKNEFQAEVFFELIQDIDIAEVPAYVGYVLEDFAKYRSSLETLEKDMVTAIIAGPPENVEAEYEKLKQAYLEAGGQAVIDEMTAYYNK